MSSYVFVGPSDIHEEDPEWARILGGSPPAVKPPPPPRIEVLHSSDSPAQPGVSATEQPGSGLPAPAKNEQPDADPSGQPGVSTPAVQFLSALEARQPGVKLQPPSSPPVMRQSVDWSPKEEPEILVAEEKPAILTAAVPSASERVAEITPVATRRVGVDVHSQVRVSRAPPDISRSRGLHLHRQGLKMRGHGIENIVRLFNYMGFKLHPTYKQQQQLWGMAILSIFHSRTKCRSESMNCIWSLCFNASGCRAKVAPFVHSKSDLSRGQTP